MGKRKTSLPRNAYEHLDALREALEEIAGGGEPESDPSQLLNQALREAARAAAGWETGSEESAASLVGQAVYELRSQKGWTQGRLADELRSVGVPWRQATVSEVEAVRTSLPPELRGDRVRRVEVEELLALAHVLETTVLALLSTEKCVLKVGSLEPGLGRGELSRLLTGEEGQ